MISRSIKKLFSKNTVFDKILSNEIPSKKVYQDSEVYAFQDSQPQAPVHVLVIPKIKDNLSGISKAQSKNVELLGKLLLTASHIAKDKKLSGYRLVINQGKDGGQSVDHLHVHLIGGRQMKWPPG